MLNFVESLCVIAGTLVWSCISVLPTVGLCQLLALPINSSRSMGIKKYSVFVFVIIKYFG